MKVSLIAAVSKNLVIGKDNDLVWHLPADMAFFKRTTAGSAVLMGRKNFYSIPERFRPLPKRRNIVITRQENHHIEEILPANEGGELVEVGTQLIVRNSVEAGIEWAKDRGEEQLYIIGGGQIYAYVLEHGLVDEMFITWIEEEFKGDTFFPEFDESVWEKEVLFRNRADDENPYDFEICRYFST